jgi:hypothetical protein
MRYDGYDGGGKIEPGFHEVFMDQHLRHLPSTDGPFLMSPKTLTQSALKDLSRSIGSSRRILAKPIFSIFRQDFAGGIGEND